MALRPRRPVVEADAVAQQQLREPVPAAHQVLADRLTRAHEVAQRLLLGPRHADRVQLAGQQQPDQQLGVAAIGLDAVARSARDLARRRDHALHAAPLELARQPVAGRPRLIRGAHRPRQPSAQPGRLSDIAGQPEPLQLARLGIEHRRHDLRRVHVQADEGSSLRHGRLLLCVVEPPRGVQPRGMNCHPTTIAGNRPPSTTAGRTELIHMV